MEFEQFVNRLITIKMLKDKVDKVGECLTLAFSDDIKYNKIYADGFNFIEDKMVSDLLDELWLNTTNENETIDIVKDIIEYAIYEVDFCRDERKFSINDIEYDCTIFNTYSEIYGTLDTEFDTFENCKYRFLKD